MVVGAALEGSTGKRVSTNEHRVEQQSRLPLVTELNMLCNASRSSTVYEMKGLILYIYVQPIIALRYVLHIV